MIAVAVSGVEGRGRTHKHGYAGKDDGVDEAGIDIGRMSLMWIIEVVAYDTSDDGGKGQLADAEEDGDDARYDWHYWYGVGCQGVGGRFLVDGM
jgi:hypothetical protein